VPLCLVMSTGLEAGGNGAVGLVPKTRGCCICPKTRGCCICPKTIPGSSQCVVRVFAYT